MSKIFISYSNDSRIHCDHVFNLANQLTEDGLKCTVEPYVSTSSVNWTQYIAKHLQEFDFILIICSKVLHQVITTESRRAARERVLDDITYQPDELSSDELSRNRCHFSSDCRQCFDEINCNETNECYDCNDRYECYDCYDCKNDRFIPVIFDQNDTQYIPPMLQNEPYYLLETSHWKNGYLVLFERLMNQIEENNVINDDINKEASGNIAWKSIPFIDQKIRYEPVMIDRLPVTGKELIGREWECRTLDDAWNNPDVHIVTIIAPGGVGKTALVNFWLNEIATRNFLDTCKVYAWSFYGQGSPYKKQTSADVFFNETFKWFSYSSLNESNKQEKTKNASFIPIERILARFMKKEKCLLILDGLEPLQYWADDAYGSCGALKDHRLKSFLEELAVGHPGLCIITSREKLTGLSGFLKPHIKEIHLQNISIDQGIEFLQNKGVNGPKKELRTFVTEFKGHPFSLSLLGNYLNKIHSGDIRKYVPVSEDGIQGKGGKNKREQSKKDGIKEIKESFPWDEKEIPAKQVMGLIENSFQQPLKWKFLKRFKRFRRIQPEQMILHIMGCFDRPIPATVLEELRKHGALTGIHSQIKKLSDSEWHFCLKNLIEFGLLTNRSRNKNTFEYLDCHPLVREYFGRRFKEIYSRAWKDVHKCLFYYYKNLPEKEFPDTLEEMEPLLSSVFHGCKAGLANKAGNLYWERILRKNNGFLIQSLGGTHTDLAVLSYFYEEPWHAPVGNLSSSWQDSILNWTTERLRAVGRLKETVLPLKAAMDVSIRQKDWNGVAIDAAKLSELMLMLGEVNQAVNYAQKSLMYASRCNDDFELQIDRTALANALHHAGEMDEAEKQFMEAESIQKKQQISFPLLYSIAGFRYCDFLLSCKKYIQVIERTEQTLEWSENYFGPVANALDKLSLGRAWLMDAVEEKDAYSYKTAHIYLCQAVGDLRKAGEYSYLVRGLLERSVFYRIQNELRKAWNDIKEAFDIAEQRGMNLYICDYHLEAGRLYEAEGKLDKAREHFKTAKEMIFNMGYFRRSPEIELD